MKPRFGDERIISPPFTLVSDTLRKGSGWESIYIEKNQEENTRPRFLWTCFRRKIVFSFYQFCERLEFLNQFFTYNNNQDFVTKSERVLFWWKDILIGDNRSTALGSRRDSFHPTNRNRKSDRHTKQVGEVLPVGS